MLTIARAKTVLLGAILIFELGSLLCAVAPNVEVLILGRAVVSAASSLYPGWAMAHKIRIAGRGWRRRSVVCLITTVCADNCIAPGIFIGVLNLIAQSVPLRLRSALMGGFGAVYGVSPQILVMDLVTHCRAAATDDQVSCAIGPLLGGAFVSPVHGERRPGERSDTCLADR